MNLQIPKDEPEISGSLPARAQLCDFSLNRQLMGNCDFKAHKEAGGTRNPFWQRWQQKYTAFRNPEEF